VDLFIDFTQLGNAIRLKIQLAQRRQILCACMFFVCRFQSLPDRSPDLMFFRGVRRIGKLLAGAIIHGNFGNLVPSRAVPRIAKARMIGIELDDGISIGDGLFDICGDGARVNVVGKYWFVCFDSHNYSHFECGDWLRLSRS
jgi:hypothetical protein